MTDPVHTGRGKPRSPVRQTEPTGECEVLSGRQNLLVNVTECITFKGFAVGRWTDRLEGVRLRRTAIPFQSPEIRTNQPSWTSTDFDVRFVLKPHGF